MNLSFFKLFFLFSLLTLASCKKELSQEEYIKYVQTSSDLNSEIGINDFLFHCTYLPADYLAIMELSKLKRRNDSIEIGAYLNSEMSKFSNGLYFQFRISLKNGEDVMRAGINSKQEYTNRMLHMESKFVDFVSIETNETIHAVLANYQRSYGLSPNVTFLIVFPFPSDYSNSKDLNFIYEDPYFGLDKVLLKFEKEHIINYKSRLRI